MPTRPTERGPLLSGCSKSAVATKYQGLLNQRPTTHKGRPRSIMANSWCARLVLGRTPLLYLYHPVVLYDDVNEAVYFGEVVGNIHQYTPIYTNIPTPKNRNQIKAQKKLNVFHLIQPRNRQHPANVSKKRRRPQQLAHTLKATLDRVHSTRLEFSEGIGERVKVFGNVFSKIAALPLAAKVLLAVAALVALAFSIPLSPFVAIVVFLVLLVAIVALILRTLQRRPLRNWGLTALASLLFVIVFSGITYAL
jgi:hypothetical protein